MARTRLVSLTLLLACAPAVFGQTTIYWQKDHIYAGPEGKEIAVVVPPSSDTTAPTAPAGVTISTVTGNSISLYWSPSTDAGGSELAGYKVYRQMGSGPSLPVGTLGISTLSFTDQPLQPSTSYTYTVVAFDNAQNHSAPSAPVNTTTSASSGDMTPPSVPVNVQAASTVYNSATINWAASIDIGGSGLAGYKVYRGGTLVSGTSLLTTTSFTDTGLSAVTTYSYTVTAADNAGNVSAASSPVSVTTPYQIIAQDNFNRPDGALGGSWQMDYWWQVQNDQAYIPSSLPYYNLAWYWLPSTASFRASVTLNNATTCSGLVWWGSVGSTWTQSTQWGDYVYFNNYYQAQYCHSGSSNWVELDSWGDYGTVAKVSIAAPSLPATMTVEANSSTLEMKVYLNGTLLIDYTQTDTSQPNHGPVGIYGDPGQLFSHFIIQALP